MSIAIVTGSAGLIGSEAVRMFSAKGMDVIGVDNGMRSYFFGQEASTTWNRDRLLNEVPGYRHETLDIRDQEAVFGLFKEVGRDVSVVVHCAAQPSHDWAANEPITDFTINANGTLVMLEATRLHCPEVPFIFTSTNKVYGDTPNRLPLEERETRWELPDSHQYGPHGIDETMSIDQTLHSVFGASKVSADVLVQEYGRYFGMKTVCFRGGCLTGPNHSGTPLHGFLAYLVRCAITGDEYTVLGYKGKQVRDNIYAADLVNTFWHFYSAPRSGEVYNMGGGRFSNCSMLEAIAICERMTGKKMNLHYSEKNRIGDHIWWISDTRRFQSHYPDWKQEYNIERILFEIHEGLKQRL
jgi:CDP-paratose 2-epimerase